MEAHLGCEWIHSHIRQYFWIIRARSIIKRIKSACIICRKRFAGKCVQQMSSLPEDRVRPGEPPFSISGVDCFGPFMVKYGRAGIKRYGCIFTCFSLRAVHIEMINSLDTSSFINALKRLISRRGKPRKLYSDKGLNFIGAHNELKMVQGQKHEQVMARFCTQLDIIWIFNPPHASHMGGVWEGMIRTTRKVLLGVLPPTTRLTDEILETVLCEVEMIINSRPITRVSDDVNDFAALTPNQLLTMRGNYGSLIRVFTQADMYKKRWRYVQLLADQFWKR